ncbi:MAG: hypothetical protein C5B59_09015 [Bacteroidetes bacterium]|nr:MAG: hypothetical protein C5B59_09015 [Bacteroidota bacterium]
MNRSLSTLLAIFFLAGQTHGQAPDPVLNLYANQYEQEKVHIHFDKDAYLPGETIWMKAYIMAGSKPSTISKSIYFDWTDVNGNLLSHSIAPIIESGASSSFAIPPAMSGGVVHVKAYTKWMLNFDSTFLYNKDIAVLSYSDGNVFPDKHFINLQFFPEGGDLVNGLSSVLAFEAIDQHGRSVNIKGAIKTGKYEMVDSFYTSHEGMGSVNFRPAANETYTAYWRDEFGENHSTPLPLAKSSGAIIRIHAPHDNAIHFQLERLADCPENFKSLTVIGTMQHQVVYKSTIELSAKTAMDQSIDMNSLPSGTMQLTLFDSHMMPFAERMIFVNSHQHQFTARLNKDAINFNKRGKNEISIEIPDTLTTNLSVSVTDGGLAVDSTNNILSDLLLSSDVKGSIINPSRYFLSKNDESAGLDLVMLTHGWRRYKWEDVIAGKLPAVKYQADTEYMSLKGQILPNSNTYNSSDSIALLFIAKDRKKHLTNLPISSNGTFIQKGVFFYDSMQVVYLINHIGRLNTNTSVNIQTSLLPPSLPLIRAGEADFQWNRIPEVILEKENGGLIMELNNYARQAAGITYAFTPVNRGDQAKGENAAHYLQTNFADLRFPTGVKERNDAVPTESRFASYSANNTQLQNAPASKSNVNLSVDGNLVTLDELKQLSMKEVLYIKFLQKTSPKDLPTLLISTRQSIDQNTVMNNKTGFAIVSGYSPLKEFCSTQYADNAEDHEATDFRSTLYWNSRIIVDKDHRKVKLVFYNNDVTNRFRVVIEGMNKAGKLVRVEELIK